MTKNSGIIGMRQKDNGEKKCGPNGEKKKMIEVITIGQNCKINRLSNLYGCRIGDNCKIDAYVYIEEDVVIGDNCKIRPFVFIPTGVTIGNNVFIGPHTVFINDKYPKAENKDWKCLHTSVDDGAVIGSNCTILPCNIGKNAIIGAGSTVTKDVYDDYVVYGNEALPRVNKLKEYGL